MELKSGYIDFIQRYVPKVLTHLDRDPDSINFGCCDRNYWHLRSSDFASAILQQTSLTLSLLYSTDFEGNRYYKNRNIYDWAIGSIDYWKRIQHRDGSFNEYFPNEHGFPPTAFSLFAIAYSYMLLKLNDNSVIDSMLKSVKWLSQREEFKAYNHEIASISALYCTYLITDQKWILEVVNKKLDVFLRGQSGEGWFPEQGGADLGYLTVTFDMFSEYYWLSRDSKVIEPLNKVTDFIKYFCHPDKTYGGEYGSRNTIYFLPSSLEVLSSIGNFNAKQIKDFLFKNTGGYDYFQNSIDDRYLLHYVMHSFLRALQKENELKKGNGTSDKNNYQENLQYNFHKELPCFKNHEKYFSDSGLLTLKNDNYFAVVSAKKGGVIKVFDSGNEIFADFGFRAIHKNNTISATNWLDDSYKIKIEKNTITVKGYFNKIKLQHSSTLRHFLLRIFSPFLNSILREFLYKKLIFIDKHSNIKFERTINLRHSNIQITDIITDNNEMLPLHSAPNISLRFVASDKFFSKTDLLSEKRIELDGVKAIKIIQDFNVFSKNTSTLVEKLS